MKISGWLLPACSERMTGGRNGATAVSDYLATTFANDEWMGPLTCSFAVIERRRTIDTSSRLAPPLIRGISLRRRHLIISIICVTAWPSAEEGLCSVGTVWKSS